MDLNSILRTSGVDMKEPNVPVLEGLEKWQRHGHTLWIRCMDKRLSQLTESVFKPGDVVVSTAGSDVNTSSATISDVLTTNFGIANVGIICHNNGCAGVAAAFDAIKKHTKFGRAYDTLVDSFKGINSDDISVYEASNTDLQVAHFDRLVSGLEASGMLAQKPDVRGFFAKVRPKTEQERKEDYNLLITTAQTIGCSELSGIDPNKLQDYFIINTNHIASAMASIYIIEEHAAEHNANTKIILSPQNQSHKEVATMESWRNLLAKSVRKTTQIIVAPPKMSVQSPEPVPMSQPQEKAGGARDRSALS
jgi:hypothetical protein